MADGRQGQTIVESRTATSSEAREVPRPWLERRRPPTVIARAGCFEWEVGSNLVRFSDELSRIYGIEPGTFGGTVNAFLARVHPDDRVQFAEIAARSFAQPRGFTREHRIVRSDGAVRLLYTRADFIHDEHGKPLRLIGTCWDVTEKRTTDESLADAVWLLRATLEATADGLIVVDRVGKITAYNDQFLKLWHIPPELASQRRDDLLLEFVLEQLTDPEGFLRNVHHLYAQPERESFDVLAFKDGRVFERLSRPQRVEGEVVGRVWSFRDVSERERLLARHVFLVDTSRLLSSLDVESALAAVARRALPYLGHGIAIDLIDADGPHRLLSHVRDRDGFDPELAATLPEDGSRIQTIDDASHLIVPLRVLDRLVGCMTFVAPPGRTYGVADASVAEELGRRAALALENARLFRESQAALQARDEFLSIASHEIRGPLTSIQLAVEALERAEDPPAYRGRMRDVVVREVGKLAQFVDDLAELGRIRTGRLHVELEEVNLSAVVRTVAARFGTELERSGSELIVRSEPDVIGVWDRALLGQVVMHLLSNAIKFGLGRPIEIEVTARGDTARLVVRDHGIGVPEDQRERIFEPFGRAVSPRNYGGLGLGLFIVRSIVERLGGVAHVAVVPDGGSRFIVELPRTRPS